jgi:hypothetical protein
MSPTPPHIFASPRIMDAVKKFINETFPDIFAHELEFYLKK